MRGDNRPYLASVDQLRAIAVLLVVFFHGCRGFNIHVAAERGIQTNGDWSYSVNPLSTILFEGHEGVTLFMVLSGFIFTVGTFGRDVSWHKFMANRLLRIYPLFLLLVVLAIAAQPKQFTFLGFLQTVLGLGNLPGSLVMNDVSSGVLWAVAVEVQFYLVFPLLNRMLSKLGIVTFLRFFAAIVVMRALVWAVSHGPLPLDMLYFNLAGRIDQFLLGMIAAWLFVKHRDRFSGWWKVALVTTTAIAMLWFYNQIHGFQSTGNWRLAWVDIEGGVWAAVVLVYVATVRSAGPVGKLVARFGELSFSVYLLHMPIMDAMIQRKLWIDVPGLSPMQNATLTTLVVALPIITVVSLVTFHGVESPFLSFRVKYLDIAKPAPRTAHDNGHEPAPQIVRETTQEPVRTGV